MVQKAYLVDAESVSQAITRAEIERKKQFDALTNSVMIEEYKEVKEISKDI
jgi:hypothetical protein